MSKMMRISTSETIMMEGERRLRTAKFMSARSGGQYLRSGSHSHRGRRFLWAAAEITFSDQFHHQRFYFHRHHLYLFRKIAEGDEGGHGDGKPEDGRIQGFGNAERNLTRVGGAGAQSQMREDMNQAGNGADKPK